MSEQKLNKKQLEKQLEIESQLKNNDENLQNQQ
jgi:hypothetical protein